MADRKKEASFHRSMHQLNHGGLHRALNVPENESIPKERIVEAEHSHNPHVRQMAVLAHNMESWGHAKK